MIFAYFIKECYISMKKLELLARINKLSSLVHSRDLDQFNLTAESKQDMQRALDKLTEEYIAAYC